MPLESQVGFACGVENGIEVGGEVGIVVGLAVGASVGVYGDTDGVRKAMWRVICSRC